MTVKTPLLSVVVPCYNEEAVISESYQRLTCVLSKISNLDYEIIFVDDGSQDHTAELLKHIQINDGHIRIVKFSRNFGHQIAVTAGIDNSSGDAVVLIDADLQDDPALIPQMIEHWRNGNDVVYGVRIDRVEETKFKIWSARIFYRLLNQLSNVAIPIDTGDFRLIDRKVVDILRSMPERDRFVRGMVSWVGFKQVAIPYQRSARLAGESKYPLFKMMQFATDGILSFSIMPLRLATWSGFITSALAVIGIFYALSLRIFTNIWVPGWTALIIAVLFIGGIQLICLGLIGEYIGRTYNEVKHRPLYIIHERLGFPESDKAIPLHNNTGLR